MKLPWWLQGVIPLVLAGLVWWAGFSCSGRLNREQAIRDSTQMASYRQTIGELSKQAARVESTYVRDTVRLRVWRTHWDTLKHVIRLTDTVPVPVEVVREVVKTADSTVQACGSALRTCEERVGLFLRLRLVDSLQIVSQSREIARLNRRRWLGCSVGPSYAPGGKPSFSWIGGTCGLTFSLKIPFLF